MSVAQCNAYKIVLIARPDTEALREAIKKVAGDSATIDLPPLPSLRKPLN
jgi:hypothetical protein